MAARGAAKSVVAQGDVFVGGFGDFATAQFHAQDGARLDGEAIGRQVFGLQGEQGVERILP